MKNLIGTSQKLLKEPTPEVLLKVIAFALLLTLPLMKFTICLFAMAKKHIKRVRLLII
jgi:hypothetical protein